MIFSATNLSNCSSNPISDKISFASEPGLGACLPITTGVKDKREAGPVVVMLPWS